jgi:hypothetical protein
MNVGVNAVHRTLDLSHLEQGRYRVEVQVVDHVTGATAKQFSTVYLQ